VARGKRTRERSRRRRIDFRKKGAQEERIPAGQGGAERRIRQDRSWWVETGEESSVRGGGGTVKNQQMIKKMISKPPGKGRYPGNLGNFKKEGLHGNRSRWRDERTEIGKTILKRFWIISTDVGGGPGSFHGGGGGGSHYRVWRQIGSVLSRKHYFGGCKFGREAYWGKEGGTGVTADS